MAKRRQGRQSDAVLSCPCCFITVCLDCQQHEVYQNQYRAMFVANCRVKTDEILRVQGNASTSAKSSKGKQNKQKKPRTLRDAAAVDRAAALNEGETFELQPLDEFLSAATVKVEGGEADDVVMMTGAEGEDVRVSYTKS